jgi:signal transduction histidine kinase
MKALADDIPAAPIERGADSHDGACDRPVLSLLSREMCRPLISIRAGFDLLLAGCEGELTPAQRQQVQGLRGQCDSLIGLTRSFLDYSAAGRGSGPLRLSTFRLGALLAEADQQFSGQAGARGIGWSCRLAGADAKVATDLALFQQVVGRLVANALEQTAEGGSVDVSGRAEADGWAIDVVDDGRGIPADALDRVFEPLIRLGAGPEPAGPSGHGMGLAVCRDVVGRLGGAISIRSEPGRGTVVTVRFPA